MSSNLHTHGRAILLAALIGASALAVPAAGSAQAVAPERALLNRLDTAPAGNGAIVTHVQAALDGERALLNRSGAVAYSPAQWPETSQPVDNASYRAGVKALLNRWSL